MIISYFNEFIVSILKDFCVLNPIEIQLKSNLNPKKLNNLYFFEYNTIKNASPKRENISYLTSL